MGLGGFCRPEAYSELMILPHSHSRFCWGRAGNGTAEKLDASALPRGPGNLPAWKHAGQTSVSAPDQPQALPSGTPRTREEKVWWREGAGMGRSLVP